MRIDAIYSIRDRSEAWKKYKSDNSKKCPWVTDEEQMILKTAVKQAAKYWPRRERLDAAIDHVNTEGEEGINFAAERQQERDITPLSETTQKEINDLLVSLDKTWDADLFPLCSRIFKRPITQPADLTEMEGVKALGFLRQKAAA